MRRKIPENTRKTAAAALGESWRRRARWSMLRSIFRRRGDRAARSDSAHVSSADDRAADVSSAVKSYGEGGTEPVFAGALRQRLALRAAACAAIARLREDEVALRDAEHLAGLNVAPTPGGRLNCRWRLFTARSVRHDARFIMGRRRLARSAA